MFDFHIHSKVSFDSEEAPENIVRAAEACGLSEICFTDHFDLHIDPDGPHDIFTLDEYGAAYDSLASERVLIRRGVEMGLVGWNKKDITELLAARKFDFVIGSVHWVGNSDPYFEEYWDCEDPFLKYLLGMKEYVSLHEDFDVLGHMTYVCKSPCNTKKRAFHYWEYADLCDEIMKILIKKDKGMEINTSGMARLGEFLPSRDFLERFYELGGRIVTVGSDAHSADRVGEHSEKAVKLAADIFGCVCTFEDRKPIFHKI